MKIAVNTRLLLHGKMEGIGWFAYETLKRITTNHPEVEFLFIFDRKPHSDFFFGSNVRWVVAHPQARHPLLWFLFFEWGVYRVLRRERPDVFLSPDGWLSLRSSTPTLAVIHDLNFEHFPQFLPKHILWYYKYFFPKFAAKASRLATVSEFTKSDIASRYKVPSNRIDVVYNGANDRFRPFSEAEKQQVRINISRGMPYFLFVGLIHPRKNLLNQLKAFDKYKASSGGKELFLVAGARHWWSKDLDIFLQQTLFSADILFMGRQSFDELVNLYGAAHAMMYASYFEGFGIPILEAFYAEIPVVTSQQSSMPEIGGGAVLLVDPSSVTDIADAMFRLSSDDDLRDELIAKGRIQRKQFSWNNSAQKLWDAILRV